MKTRLIQTLQHLILLILASLLAGCAGSGVAFYSFGFDIRNATPAVEILDYLYGDSNAPVSRRPEWTKSPEWTKKYGSGTYFDAKGGHMRIGKSVYVKWRVKETGQIYEDTVDLRQRLPFNMEDHKIYLDIGGSQLYVYLIGPEAEKVDPNPCPPMGKLRPLYSSEKSADRIFARYCNLKITLLYPDTPKAKQ